MSLSSRSSGDRPVESLLRNGAFKNRNGNFGTLQFSWSRDIDLPKDSKVVTQQFVDQILRTIAPRHLEAFNNAIKPSVTATSITASSASQGIIQTRIRREIRQMSAEDQQRFVDAVFTMMSNGQWMRIAGYHGWPSNAGNGYCAHRAENFPGWHRAYLLEMETALIAADIANGRDGSISMPYWEFGRYDLNGQTLPAIIEKNFGGSFQFPLGFFNSVNPTQASDLIRNRFTKVVTNKALKARLQSADISGLSNACLDISANHEHWLFASTENTSSVPVEEPHNNTHVALGYPLSSLSFAAFHPIFWLLHCNVDRIYETYLRRVGPAECALELENHQLVAEQSHLTNLAKQTLEPFSKPETLLHTDLYLNGMLVTTSLGYEYDKLLAIPGQQLRSMPTYVVFSNVDVVYNLIDSNNNLKSFTLHLFLIPKKITTTEGYVIGVPVHGNVSEYSSHPHYAGSIGVFAGKGPKCKNCAETKPINIKKDVSDKLLELGCESRFLAEIRVIVEDEMGQICALEELSVVYGPNCKLPQPSLVGPLFEPSSGELTVSSEDKANVMQLQKLLKKFGFYTSEVDGSFGPLTTAALVEYQYATGLLPDGVAGAITKAQMVAPLHDSHPHKVGVGESTIDHQQPLYTPRSIVYYFLGVTPGYLDVSAFEHVIEDCMSQWAAVTGLSFQKTNDESKATLKVIFGVSNNADPSKGKDELLQFDGPGGELARFIDQSIIFDKAER
eukprot:gene5042-10102_t